MKKRISLFFAAMVMMTSSLLTLYVAPDANAVGGSCFFGGGACGVTGRGAYGVNDVFTGRDSSGNGSALGGVTTKQEFINFITNRFNSNNAQDKTGAQLVIAKNLQLNGRPTGANLNKWRDIMADESVSFSRDNGFPVKRTSWYVPSKNDVFFADDNVVRDIIRIRQNGHVVSELEIPCGNLIASGQPLKENIDFDLSHHAVLDNGEADMDVRRGTTHTFHFWVKNDGPDDMNVRLSARAEWDGGARSGIKTRCNLDRGLRNNEKEEGCKNDLIIPNNASNGTKYCQRLYYDPKSSTNTGEQKSQKLCYKVVFDVSTGGDFIPSVGVNTEAAEPSTNYQWWAQVTAGMIPVSDWPDAESYPVNAVASSRPGHRYSEQTLKQSEITWEVHKIVYKPTDSGVYNNGSTSAFACPAGTTCSQIATSPSPDHANGKPPHGSGDTVRIDKDPELLEGNLASGSRVCYVSSVYLPPQLSDSVKHEYIDHYKDVDPDGDDPLPASPEAVYATDYHRRYVASRDWRHSEEACIMVGKRPRLQILGGDLSVGGLIRVGTSDYADLPKKTFGSWVEYAALSGGVNKFMASGAALSGGKDPIVNKSAWSHLTFANTDDTAYGKFLLLSDAPQLREYYSSRVSGPWTGGSLGGQHGIYSADNVTLSGGGVSGSIVIVSSGKVTIDGDISYNNGPYSSFEALPQVIIIAKNIEITKDVKNIDAWLVTTGVDGSILTCNEVDRNAELSNAICNNKLTVNGPIMTSNLYLRRTAGAKNESTRGDPAEVFNFRPDAYLWAYHQNLTTTGSIPRTVELTELPPRY